MYIYTQVYSEKRERDREGLTMESEKNDYHKSKNTNYWFIPTKYKCNVDNNKLTS